MVSENAGLSNLEINQALDFQRRRQLVERVGWIAMALVVLAALVGLFGPGLLSAARAGETDGPLWMEYNRFARLQAPQTLRAHLGPDAAKNGEARVWLDREYLQSVQVQQVTPQPALVVAGPDRLTYVFEVDGTEQPTAVTFNVLPDSFGPLRGRVGLEGGGSFGFTQFVYP